MTIGCNSQGSEIVVGFCTFVLRSIIAGYNSAQAALRGLETHINQQQIATKQSTCSFVKKKKKKICLYRKACVYCLFKCICIRVKAITINVYRLHNNSLSDMLRLCFFVAVGLYRLS